MWSVKTWDPYDSPIELSEDHDMRRAENKINCIPGMDEFDRLDDTRNWPNLR
jgi:hypothetical protein